MRSILLLMLLALAGCGSAYGDVKLPSKFYVDAAWPDDKLYIVQVAFDVWNAGLGVDVFEFAGRTDKSYNVRDDSNVLYWGLNPENPDALGDAAALWDKDTRKVPGKIFCDVRIKSALFSNSGTIVIPADETVVVTPNLSVTVLAHVLVHELGHCLTLPHSENMQSIMYKYADTSARDYPRLNEEDIIHALQQLGMSNE
jgi:hypothetical protein